MKYNHKCTNNIVSERLLGVDNLQLLCHCTGQASGYYYHVYHSLIRNYILNQWKSRVSQEEAKYSDFFEQLQKLCPSAVQDAYDTWLNVCHKPLSLKQNLVSLNEIYEVFMVLENDVLKSFEQRVNVESLVETIKLISSQLEYTLRQNQLFSVHKIFEFLKKYWSFYNCQLFMDIVSELGSNEDIKEAAFYSDLIDRISNLSIGEIPQSIHGNAYMAMERTEELKVLVEIDNTSVSILRRVHVAFAKMFDFHPCLMHLVRVTKSSAETKECELHFLACKWLEEDIINVPNEYHMAEELHIVSYDIGGQVFKVRNPSYVMG